MKINMRIKKNIGTRVFTSVKNNFSNSAFFFLGFLFCHSVVFSQTTEINNTTPRSISLKNNTDGEVELKRIPVEVLVNFENKDYQKVISLSKKYYSLGGRNSQIRFITAQSYFYLKDYENAARELQFDIFTIERNTKKPEEEKLLLLQKCYFNLNDLDANIWVFEKLVRYYNKKQYWAELLTRLGRRPDFRDRLQIDILRLKLRTQTLDGSLEYLSLISQLISLGYLSEAKSVIDQMSNSLSIVNESDQSKIKFYKDSILKQIEAQKSIFKLNEKEILRIQTNWTLVDLGYAYVTLGQYNKGIEMIERGIKNNSYINRPQDAKLVYAQALFTSGQRQKSIRVLSSITGLHGAADLAQVWLLYITILDS